MLVSVARIITITINVDFDSEKSYNNWVSFDG